MKKILHIQVLPKMAGVQWISYHILKSLSETDFEKHILFSSEMDSENKNLCKEIFEGIGCKVLFLKSLKRSISLLDIIAIRDIYELCKKEKYDIVHTNSTKPGIVGRIAAKLAHVPYIIHTVHGLAFHKFIRFPKWQFYWACEMFASIFCDQIVIVNNYYTKYFKWYNYKVTTIYNGLKYPESNISTYHPQNDIIKLLFVGRLSLQKDPITMIKAFEIAHKVKSNIQLTIVGDGELLGICKKYVEDRGLEQCISFEGWQNDVHTYYKTHDIFITTSIYEAFGLVFLDAGFNKLPTVATNVEGIPEVIEDGVTGLLSRPKDLDGIAENILKLSNDAILRAVMGEKAFDRVTTKFSLKNMTSAYLRLYNNN